MAGVGGSEAARFVLGVVGVGVVVIALACEMRQGRASGAYDLMRGGGRGRTRFMRAV